MFKLRGCFRVNGVCKLRGFDDCQISSSGP